MMADKLLDIKVENTRPLIGSAMPSAISCDLLPVKVEDEVILGEEGGTIDTEIGLNGIKVENVDAAPKDVETSGGQSVNTSVSIKKEVLGICYDLVRKVKMEKEEDGTNYAGLRVKGVFADEEQRPIIDQIFCHTDSPGQKTEPSNVSAMDTVEGEIAVLQLDSTEPADTETDNVTSPSSASTARQERANCRKRRREEQKSTKDSAQPSSSLKRPIEFHYCPDGDGIYMPVSGPSIFFELKDWNFLLNAGRPTSAVFRTDLPNPVETTEEHQSFKLLRYEGTNFYAVVVSVTLEEYATCPPSLQATLIDIFKMVEEEERVLYCRFIKVTTSEGPRDSFTIKGLNNNDLVVPDEEQIQIIDPTLLIRFLRSTPVMLVETVWVAEHEPEPCPFLTLTEASVGVFVAAYWPEIFKEGLVCSASFRKARDDDALTKIMQASLNSITAWGVDKALNKPRDFIRGIPTKRTVASWLEQQFFVASIPILQRPHLCPIESIINGPILQPLRPIDIKKSTLPEDHPPLETRAAHKAKVAERFAIFQRLRRSGLLRIRVV